jgi:gamma-butyrobetaine dioxygenase
MSFHSLFRFSDRCLRFISSRKGLFPLTIPNYYTLGQRSLAIVAEESSITIPSLKTSFPYIWLRDSCQSPVCVHPSTSQKLHRTSDIPINIKPIPGGIESSDDGIRIEWMDGHRSFFDLSFLERHSSPANLYKFHRDVSYEPWNAERISTAPTLFLPYASLQQPHGLLTAITQLSKYGLVFITGVPNSETSNDTCELRKLAEYFGEIRHTFYGEVWDVKNVQNSRNIAYTNLDLGLHMDLLYDTFFDHLN